MFNMLKLESFGATDIGQIRLKNEDQYFIDPENRFFIVADGMGGMNKGDVASHIAVNEIVAFLQSVDTNGQISQLLIDAVLTANDKIKLKATDPGYHNMGTTILLGYFVDPVLHIVHVGDSRAYHIRKSKIKFITEDHTIVAQLLKRKIISEDEAKTHPLRNHLTQALGQQSALTPSYHSISIMRNDMIILCTDGLWNMLPNKEMLRFLNVQSPLERITKSMIVEANNRGGRDNITIVTLSFQDSKTV